MDNILVSVVIPTKNRYNTLFPLINAIKDICELHKDLEIIVQDNSDDNTEAKVFFEQLNLSNLKYYYESNWVSVGGNSDLAILHSNGEFVSFIGDDDAFTEQIIEVAAFMKKYNYEACNCNYAMYRWPLALINKKYSLEYMNYGHILRFLDGEEELRKAMHHGMQTKKYMPGVYHGLVKRSCLDEIYKKTGTFFPGPSPDMANSVAFIIDGYSKASTGHLTETKKHIGKLEEQPFLPKDTIEKWTEYIPKIWLPNTIWPESAIQALKRMNREDLVSEFNHTVMYVKISKIYPQCRELCIVYAKKYSNIFRYVLACCNVILTFIKNRLLEQIKRLMSNGNFNISEKLDVRDAILITSEYIERNNMIKRLYDEILKVKQ